MAQAFVTSYRNHYRWHKEKVRKSKKPYDKHCEVPPEGDYWIGQVPLKHVKDKDINLPLAEALIKQSTRRQLFSTYQTKYCTEYVREINNTMKLAVKQASGNLDTEVQTEGSFENELLKYCNDLYSANTMKILPPLPTARRVHGYIRPESMYTPLTHYQVDYGKAGYDILSNPGQYLKRQKIDDDNSIEVPLKTSDQNARKTCEELKPIRKIEEKKVKTRPIEKPQRVRSTFNVGYVELFPYKNSKKNNKH